MFIPRRTANNILCVFTYVRRAVCRRTEIVSRGTDSNKAFGM